MKKITGLLIIMVFHNVVLANEADAILGLWKTKENKSKVEIYKCENKYCGRINWLKNPLYPADDHKGMAGKVKLDRKNPDETLRSKPLIGLNIIKEFVFEDLGDDDDDPMWMNGEIYDPDNGKLYSCTLTLIDPSILEVRGYIGIPLFGRTETWRR